MSRSIAESLSLLSETLDNCKTNLTEKQVADVDNIKISDVDEKIAEIQAGGGDEPFAKVVSFKVAGKENIGSRYTYFPQRSSDTVEIVIDKEVYNGTLLYLNNCGYDNFKMGKITIQKDEQDPTKYTADKNDSGIYLYGDYSTYTLIFLGAKRYDSKDEVLYLLSEYVAGE